MRIILQDQQTGMYLTDDHGWTERKQLAKDFPSVKEAEAYCQKHEVRAVALAVRGDEVYKLDLDCEKKKAMKETSS
jgi:hypothetical protein